MPKSHCQPKQSSIGRGSPTIPSRVGCCSLSSQIQSTYLANLWWRRFPKSTHILFQIPVWKCSIKRCYSSSFVHWHPKGVAFEWFMKLLAGSIKSWADLEKPFLARFFEDETKVFVPTILAIKLKKGESIKMFVERFWSMTLWCLSGMTQSTLWKKNLPPQYANHAPSLNRSDRVSHLKAASAPRRKSEGNHCQG